MPGRQRIQTARQRIQTARQRIQMARQRIQTARQRIQTIDNKIKQKYLIKTLARENIKSVAREFDLKENQN